MKGMILLIALMAPAMAAAQSDSTAAAKQIVHAAAALDSASKAKGVRMAVVDNANVIYAAAVGQLSSGNYEGAERMAEVALRLAHGAQHGPEEIGARIDSVPFGAIAAPPGVPPIPPSPAPGPY